MSARRRLPSALLTRSWTVPTAGRVRVASATHAHLTEIDAEWPRSRKVTDWNRSWRWKELASGKLEVFVVIGPSGKVLGIWCSAKRTPIQLSGVSFYRPDFLELEPSIRGQAMGVFLFMLLAARALEIGAQGIVFGTWPVLRAFYRELGGIEGRPRGWNLATGLLPFTFNAETLRGLKQALDGMEDDGQDPTKV